MANKYFKIVLVFSFLLVSDFILAGGPPPPPPPESPIDGGILGLLALGVGFAVNRIYKSNKR